MYSNLLAVADGVGGWNSRGVDPALFSRELCENVKSDYIVQKNFYGSSSEIDIKKLLIDAVAKTKSKGSSTFVMLMIDE